MPIHKENSLRADAMTPTLRKGMACRERAVAPTTLPTYTADLEHDGRGYTVTLNNFEVLQCQRCGAIVLDDAADDRLSERASPRSGAINAR